MARFVTNEQARKSGFEPTVLVPVSCRRAPPPTDGFWSDCTRSVVFSHGTAVNIDNTNDGTWIVCGFWAHSLDMRLILVTLGLSGTSVRW